VDPATLLFLVAVGVVAGVINTLAGGGSLITLPALIMAGLPADVANGTNRVGILAASATATRRYQREGMYDQAFDRWTWTAACLGAVAGSWVSIELDEVLLRQVIGVAMLLMLGVLMTEPKVWLEGKAQAAPAWARALGFFFIGAYGGFLQAGVGYFLLAGFVLLSGHDLVRANSEKVALVLLYTVPAFAVFWWSGRVSWLPGLALAAGSAAGGWLGARWTMAWGPSAVRWVLMGMVVGSSGRLLGLW
jgi:uncharacterized membrane protein YfcA